MKTSTVDRFKLRSMPSAMCHITIAQDDVGSEITLRSYYTDVLCISVDDQHQSVTLFATGTYSVTTARHINRFTKEFFGENLYHQIKFELAGYNGHQYVEIAHSSDMKIYSRVRQAIVEYMYYGIKFHDYTKSQVERWRAHLYY